ncbi:MAG: PorV/PorQ family protein [candidate division WOR-3 bacterium]|nr:PorV/PorQ family protein [candidate division WOR-3 bacterium]MCX7757058.1 PorV/PorQ family protein [candidate division WOR-3 bacterium]MDW7987243.1 PorV/PorQ family protein [candidate division WOR-3 bacterium]
MSPLNSFVSLKIVPSAREQSMGGVGNVSAIGPQGMYFNPSITAGLRSFALAINYQRRFLDTYAQSVFLIRSFKNFNVGFGLNTFNAGKIEVRPPWPTDEVFGEINPADFTFYFNISREIKVQDKTFRLGASPRLYYSKIGEYSASGYGIDLGMFFASIPNFNWGISLLDFGSEIRYYRIRDNLPTRLVGGVEYFLNLSRMKFLSNFKIGADFNYFVYERTSNLNIGGELNINKRLFIRAGYRINNKNEPYSFGLGVVAKKLRFDYAFIPYSLNLGIGHHLSIGLGY